MKASVLLVSMVVWALLAAADAARAATILGGNFDGNLSVIYDSGSGNVFLENGPLPNPAVKRLLINSAGGLLLPGNLTVPSLSPPVTIVNATPFQVDVDWSGGNFLGTGSFVGGILPPGQAAGTLLTDLSIEWTPAVGGPAPGDLIHGTYGNLQNHPVLPNSGGNGFFRFFNVQTGQFMDPPWAGGFEYEMTSPSLFTRLGLPLGYGNSFSVGVGGTTLISGLTEGNAYTFPGLGVPSFWLRGISPVVDAAQPDAFPLYLEFNTPTASFNMTALTVPEPASLGLLALTALLALRRRR